MDFKQIYQFANQATKEALGETAVLKEDLSNIVDIGTAVFNSNALDKYVKSLVDHIGKVIFVNRVYTMRAPSVLMDAWEYGQVCEKIRGELPEAVENDTWNLTDGESYDENIFKAPVIKAKFFDKRTTLEVDISITERQARGAFSSAAQMGGFIAMIYTDIDNSIEIKNEKLVMATICNGIAETYQSDVGSKITTSVTADKLTGVKAVNLLKCYNDESGKALTADKALLDVDFIKYASYQILSYSDKLTTFSKLFNVGGTAKFTPKSDQKIVLLSDFARRADVYLQSDTFHNELTRLPSHDDVMYWQGSGTGFSLADCGKIVVKTASGDDVTISQCLGVIFDREALGVTNYNRRVTTKYNAKAEFTNFFHKVDAGYFNDLDENMVMFFIA